MRIRKTAAIILALVVTMSLAMPAFAAATGYGPGTTGGSSSSSGGGSGGGGYTPPSTPPAPTAADVKTATTNAIKQAATTGSATVKLENVSTLPASAIKDVFTQAAKAGVKDTVITMDVKENGAILSRVYVDADTAAKLNGTVNFSVATKGAAVENTVNKFEKFFDNKVAAVSLGQKGAFGADIKMAVKVDLSKLNTSNLVFYAYNKETGKYTKVETNYKVDSKGYLHFTTPVGGDIIISDKPLIRK